MLTPYELGYAAYLAGKSQEENPYDSDDSPVSRKRWNAGWLACKTKRSEVLR